MSQEPQSAHVPKSGAAEIKPVRFIRLPEVRQITGLSRSQIYRLQADPASNFPHRIKLGNGPTSATAFIESEIMAWCASRIQASRLQAA